MSDEALQKPDVIKRLDEHEISRTHAAPLLSCWSDATGHLLVELRFAPTASTFDDCHSTQSYLMRFGKPIAFYSDKCGVLVVHRPTLRLIMFAK